MRAISVSLVMLGTALSNAISPGQVAAQVSSSSESEHAATALSGPGTTVTSSQPTGDQPLFPPRKPAEMRAAVSAALQATAQFSAKDPAGSDTAVRQLMLLLLELEQDHNLPHEDRVGLHTEVRSRLLTIEKQLRAEMARQGMDVRVGTTANAPAINSAQQMAEPANLILAQQVQPGGVAPNGAGPVRGGAAAAGNGRPAVNGANRRRAQANTNDYGPELVALIEQVVAPRTWDVNGGPGTVVYYGNLRALVVRAPTEVHDQVGDLLGQLRK